jgi:hypothetical protein
MSGDDDLEHYTGKLLSWDFFHSDSSIGKVEGNKIRKRLDAYYEGDGNVDPILIKIPPGPFRPEIVRNPAAIPILTGEMTELVRSALDLMKSVDTMAQADQLLDQALVLHPSHPEVLGVRAQFYANAAFLPSFPDVALFLEKADEVVSEGKENNILTWRMLYAEGAVESALRWNWTAAGNAFRRARATSMPRGASADWYMLFLISQNDFESAADVIADECQTLPAKVLYENVAFLEALAGRPTAGLAALARLKQLLPSAGTSGSLPVLLEAVDDLQACLNVLNAEDNEASEPTLMTAFKAVCAGRLGRKREARRLYKRIVQADAKIPEGANGPFTSSFPLAIAAIGLNDHDLAVEWLAKCALIDREPYSLLFHVLPTLRHLKHHAGFQQLLERMRLVAPK